MSKTWATTLALTVMALGSCQPTPSDTSLGQTDAVVSSTSTTMAIPTTTALVAEPARATTTTASLPPSTNTTTTTTTTTLPPSTTTTVSPSTTTTTTIGATQTTSITVSAASEDVTDEENSPSAHRVSVSTVEFMPGLRADIHAPDRAGDYPMIALVFGGGWAVGDHTQMSALAHQLASVGMVVINGDHRTLLRGQRLPGMLEEVNCLAAAAPYLAAPHLSEPADPVWLLGFSSGAHLAAVTALGSSPLPDQCPYETPEVAGMIGLAGPYDLDQLWNEGVLTNLLASEVLREHFPELATFLQEQNRAAMQIFLRLLTGAIPDMPEAWNPLNPIHLAPNHPERSFLLITGGQDQVIPPSHSTRFAEALTAGGHQALTHTITEADHVALTYPETVADLVIDFLSKESHLQSSR